METATATKPEKKWTKEYMREYQRKYMREKWRRDHNVKPENYLGERSRIIPENLEEEAKKFGDGAVEFLKHQQQKKKEKKKKNPPNPPVSTVVCQICLGEHKDTTGQKKMHERTVRHRLAAEIYEAHKALLTQQ